MKKQTFLPKSFPFAILLFMVSFLKAQINEATIGENIKSQVIWVTDIGKFGETKYKSSELRFNRNGLCIEEIKFNKRGKIIFHKSYDFNKGLLVAEIEFDSKGFIVQRIEYRYANKVPVEKIVYDGKGIITRNEQMIYEYQD